MSGTVLGDTPASVGVNTPAVNVPAATPTDLVAADATRLEVIFYNQGPDAVAIGLTGITWANRAIVLNAGDCYIEARLAAKPWQAITDAGTTAKVGIQERKA